MEIRKEIQLDGIEEETANKLIKLLKEKGYDSRYEYEIGSVIYENYKESDDIACEFIGVYSMHEYDNEHKYLGGKK